MLRGHSGVAVIGIAVLRASNKDDDASFFIARSSEDLDSLGRESAKDTLVVIIPRLPGECL